MKHTKLAAFAAAALMLGTASCSQQKEKVAPNRLHQVAGASDTDDETPVEPDYDTPQDPEYDAPGGEDPLADAATTDVIPTVTVMNQLFRDIARNSCGLTYGQPGCIPFQYTSDGCYARAHAMRRILINKGYTCRKVFSYNTLPGSTLAVRKITGQLKCVKWWYHVAPVVKVNNGSKVEEYVFDPSMFGVPVTIFDWLNGQRAGCAGGAVTFHTIVNSRNYVPTNRPIAEEKNITSFGTDDTYSSTDKALLTFANAVD